MVARDLLPGGAPARLSADKAATLMPACTVARSQADIDRGLAAAAGSGQAAPALPKGMSMETAEMIERALREADGTLSATECAVLTGVSRVSVRRYLEHFRTVGRAEVSLRYGVTGRPERRYRFRDLPGRLRPNDQARA